MSLKRSIIATVLAVSCASLFCIAVAQVQQEDQGPSLSESLQNANQLHSQEKFQQEYDYLTSLPPWTDPDDQIRAGVKRAEILSRYLRKDRGLALEITQGLIDKFQDHPSIYLARWRVAREYLLELPYPQRDIGKAQGILADLIKGYPGAAEIGEIRSDYAYSFYLQRNYTAAIEEFRHLLGSNSMTKRKPFAAYMIGDSYYRMGQQDQAIETWTSLTRGYPGDSWANAASQRISILSGNATQPATGQ